MNAINRDYLGALLQVASRICGYLEGITPEQRAVLEFLAEIPQSQNGGWIKAVDLMAHSAPNAKAIPGLAARGLVEETKRGAFRYFHIADEGIDLLGRIEERAARDQFLQRFRALLGTPITVHKERAHMVTTVVIQRRVIEALQGGPAKREQLVAALQVTDDQLDRSLRKLKAAGTVRSNGGIYNLESKEGAA
jgi:hypothetical protein